MNVKGEIIEYINAQENNGAFLLTGKWGCGKSYLVRKIVKELNAGSEYSVAMISLFGIASVAELNRRVKDEYLEFQSELFGKKARKFYDVFSKFAKESAAITAAALPDKATAAAVSVGVNSVTSFDVLNFISVKNYVKRGEKEEKFILVFDDFERCDIPYPQLMGAINEYIENKRIKTIIIADENKIISTENEEFDYYDFKEKLISRTIKIEPDHSETIHGIIEKFNSKTEEYKQFLLNNEQILLSAFEHSEYNNLRSFKACIMDFERAHSVWVKSGIPLDDIPNVLYQFCACTYECKAGNYVQSTEYSYYMFPVKNDDEKSIKEKYVEDTFSQSIYSLSNWIVNGDWNEDAFVDELKRRYTVEDVSREYKFLNVMFWDLEQEDIDEGMPVAVEKANNGDLTRDELIVLLQRIHSLKTNNIPLPCEIDYKSIKNGFQIRKNDIKKGLVSETPRHLFSEKNQLDAEAIEIYEDIERCDKLEYAWNTRRDFINCLTYKDYTKLYALKNRYIDCFDSELFDIFAKAYDEAANSNKRQLGWTLTGFDFSKSFENTKENIKITIDYFGNLKEHLTEQSKITSDQIGKGLNTWFIKEIDKKTNELQENNT